MLPAITNRLLWGIGLAAFLLSALVQMPATWLYAGLQSRLAPVQLYGLQGSWTAATASGLGVQNRLVLQDLRWRLQPLALLMGRAQLHVEGGGQIATLAGLLSSSLWNQRADDLRLVGSVRNLAGAAGLPYVPVDGQVGLNLKTLVWAGDRPERAEGSLDLRGLAWTLAREPLLLGDFHVDIHTEAEAIVVTITAPSGPLDATGNARLLADRRYEIDLLIKARPGASEMLQNTVRTLGTPDAQGNYHVRQQGQWKAM